MPIGWRPESTATYQAAKERLSGWMRTPPRQCLWCWGQEVLWEKSEAFGVFMPVACPHCHPRHLLDEE